MIDRLITDREGVYVDATVGSGGHAEEILRRCGDAARVFGIDRDPEAIERTRQRIKDPRLTLIQGRFSQMSDLLKGFSTEEVDGVLMDLGVSLEQLKSEERGFSFHSDAPLDMRMDMEGDLTAEVIVNRWTERQIEDILRRYGEEKRARLIAREIVRQRSRAPIKRCSELASVVERVYGRRGRVHPATRTFQALRIAVNNEIEELQSGLQEALKLLKKGGRLCVISYHSLEDRVVKRFLLEMEKERKMRRLTKKPITPSEQERRLNPSSRSAKLRVGERL